MTLGRGVAGVAIVGGGVALYFLLAGTVSTGEAIGCAITLAILIPYGVAVARTGTVPMQVPVRGVRSLLRAGGAIVPELWHVGRALARAAMRRPEGMAGVVKRVPFRFGAFDPADVGRRATVGTAMSLAPNGIVLGTDRQADELILHQLIDRSVGGDPEWPL